ncbi:unnamed protein product [Miscanthus lutarioriparius]|uniref:Uncharacterized protein n=1 Tax=Miscanthus lutarioriparius TaxID=422564 RepID=A0A811NNZ6_9POAL|nr:unnamed protein product [Miscanthus lutarioriparius]
MEAAAAPSVSVAGGRGRDEKTQPRPAAAAAACDVEALRRCLEENKGDRVKCQAPSAPPAPPALTPAPSCSPPREERTVSDRRKDRRASSGSKQIFFFSPYNVFSVVAFW